jgi:uncharacterized protein with GYD domain
MPKFLIEASYTTDGLKGLQKDKASGRLAAVKEALASLGGTLDSMHYSLGTDDVIVIVDVPDAGAAAAFSAAASASGRVRTKTTALLTIAEMDEALSKAPAYRAPGQ